LKGARDIAFLLKNGSTWPEKSAFRNFGETASTKNRKDAEIVN
jgi:hypothetical protein